MLRLFTLLGFCGSTRCTQESFPALFFGSQQPCMFYGNEFYLVFLLSHERRKRKEKKRRGNEMQLALMPQVCRWWSTTIQPSHLKHSSSSVTIPSMVWIYPRCNLPSASTHCTFSFHLTFKRLVLQFQGWGQLLFVQIMQYLQVVETESDEHCSFYCFQHCIKPVHTNTSWTILTMRTLRGWRNSSKSTYLCAAYLHQYNSLHCLEKLQILPASIGVLVCKKNIWSCIEPDNRTNNPNFCSSLL